MKHRHPLFAMAQKFNQYGVTIGGPVFVPKLFNGHDKLFFFFAFEDLPDSTPSTTTNTVPTEADAPVTSPRYCLWVTPVGIWGPIAVIARTGVPTHTSFTTHARRRWLAPRHP